MASEVQVDVKVTVAWWYRPYLNTLLWFAQLTGMQPDEDKLVEVIRRALRVKVGPVTKRGAD